MMEKCLQTIGVTGSHFLFALNNAEEMHCQWHQCFSFGQVGSHRAGVGIRTMLLLICRIYATQSPEEAGSPEACSQTDSRHPS